MEASNGARSSRLHRARRSRLITARRKDRSAAEARLNKQAALLHAEVRAMLNEALDWEWGICADDTLWPDRSSCDEPSVGIESVWAGLRRPATSLWPAAGESTSTDA